MSRAIFVSNNHFISAVTVEIGSQKAKPTRAITHSSARALPEDARSLIRLRGSGRRSLKRVNLFGTAFGMMR